MYNNIEQKYLPIGTIVVLKGGTKRVMITGFCAAGEDSNVEYDYSGCLYPEGFISYSQICLFNHDQIDKIFFMGLIDEEEKEFKRNLIKLINDNNEEVLDIDDDIEIIEETPTIKF